MGLDSSIFNNNPEPKNEFDILGEELVYFRKFYSFHVWICTNCERVDHDVFYDVYKITRNNILEFIEFYKKEEDVFDVETEKIEPLHELLKTSTDDFWYYEYCD